MVRPCFLMVDREYAGSISTRKLVIETAKLNVLTAYSGREALEMLELFPAVRGIVLDAGVTDVPHRDLVRQLKAMAPAVPVVVIHSYGFESSEDADYRLDSFDPTKLLFLLKTLTPKEASIIEARDQSLVAK